MRIAIMLVVGAFAACGAQAEVRSLARDHGQYGLGDPHGGPSQRQSAAAGPSAVRCLVRKADGRRFCRTLLRWREIARRTDGEAGQQR
jgi:hypothetical protein